MSRKYVRCLDMTSSNRCQLKDYPIWPSAAMPRAPQRCTLSTIRLAVSSLSQDTRHNKVFLAGTLNALLVDALKTGSAPIIRVTIILIPPYSLMA